MMLNLLLMSCGALHAVDPAAHGNGDFRIRANVIEALECGPCVVQVECYYDGKKELPTCREGPFSETAPQSWKLPPVKSFVECRACGGTGTLERGCISSQTLFLHREYEIPAGPARLKITKKIYQGEEGDAEKEPWGRNFKLIATPSAEIVIDVLPATPKNATAFCERFERNLNPSLPSVFYVQLSYLYNTRHPALAALAWRIMEHYPSSWFGRQLFELAGEYSESGAEAEAYFLKLANNPRFLSRSSLFNYWSARRKPLSQAAFAALSQSEQLWTRVLTYIHFTNRCEQPWIDTLFRDLADLAKPIPDSRFICLLRELDNESFAAREKAMVELGGYGERGVGQLRHVLKGTLSAEAKRRVRQLLEEIESGKASPEWKPILEYLKDTAKGPQTRVLEKTEYDRDSGAVRSIRVIRWWPEAHAVLTTLSKGNPKAAITKAAKAALQRRAELFSEER